MSLFYSVASAESIKLKSCEMASNIKDARTASLCTRIDTKLKRLDAIQAGRDPNESSDVTDAEHSELMESPETSRIAETDPGIPRKCKHSVDRGNNVLSDATNAVNSRPSEYVETNVLSQTDSVIPQKRRNNVDDHDEETNQCRKRQKLSVLELANGHDLDELMCENENEPEPENPKVVDYISRLAELSKKKFMYLLREDVVWTLDDDQWDKVKKELKKRLVQNPKMIQKKKQRKYPNVDWKMIRNQFQKMLQSLSASELMEMRASLEHKDIEDERERRLNEIKQITYERKIGKFKQGYDYEKDRSNHVILIGSGTHQQRMVAQVREQREYNKTKKVESRKFNLYHH